MDNKINPETIFIVISVFILFVNKVVEMMKERHAEKASRRARKEQRTGAPQQPRQRRPPLQSTRRTLGGAPAPTAEPPARRQQPSPSPLKDVLTELFEAAGVPTPQPPASKPSVQSKQPPPIPGVRSRTTPKLSKAEREALERLEARTEHSALNRRRIRKESADRITSLLLSRDAARQAVVVAEILGPPRAFQELEQR